MTSPNVLAVTAAGKAKSYKHSLRNKKEENNTRFQLLLDYMYNGRNKENCCWRTKNLIMKNWD